MRHHTIVVLLTCASALGGCSSPETQAPSGTGTPGGTPSTLTFHTGEFEVPAGDSFECFYTDTITDRELHSVSASATQGPGGHHVTVYYTDTVREAQHHPCTDAHVRREPPSAATRRSRSAKRARRGATGSARAVTH